MWVSVFYRYPVFDVNQNSPEEKCFIDELARALLATLGVSQQEPSSSLECKMDSFEEKNKSSPP